MEAAATLTPTFLAEAETAASAEALTDFETVLLASEPSKVLGS